MQLSLFDESFIHSSVQDLEKNNYYLIYLSSKNGNGKPLYFVEGLESAQAVCSDSATSGIFFGGEWALFFTSMQNWLKCGGGWEVPLIDSGAQDALLARLNIKKLGMEDIKNNL